MAPEKVEKFAVALGLLGLVGIGLFIRVHGFGKYYYSPDEAFQLWMSGQPTWAGVWGLAIHHPHAPLHYLILHEMLRLSRNKLFLDTSSLLPGLALIPLFYLFGRRVSGTVCGISMAFMAAFGYAAIILSQAIRPYCLIATFMVAGLYFLATYLVTDNKRNILGYAGGMTLALLMHYMMAVVIASAGTVWLAHLAFRRRPVREYAEMAAAHLPIGMTAAFLYFYHLRHIFASQRFANPVEEWIAPYFFSDLPGFVRNMQDLFSFFFMQPNALWAMTLAVLGMAALVKQGRRDILAIILLVLGINIAFTLTGKFSLGGIRHSFYLFPFAALLMGAALQAAYDYGKQLLKERRPGVLSRLEPAPSGTIMLLPAALIAVSVLTAASYQESDYLRRYSGKSYTEMPVLKENFDRTWDYLRSRPQPGDVVYASYQTVIYVLYDTMRPAMRVRRNIAMVNYQGRPIYYVSYGWGARWGIGKSDELTMDVGELISSIKLPDGANLWIANIGWEGKVPFLSSDPFWAGMVSSKFEEPDGGAVYCLRGDAIKNQSSLILRARHRTRIFKAVER